MLSGSDKNQKCCNENRTPLPLLPITRVSFSCRERLMFVFDTSVSAQVIWPLYVVK